MRWWDERKIESGSEVEASVGLLRMRVARQAGLSRVAWWHVEGAEEPVAVDVSEPAPPADPPEGWKVERFASDGEGDGFQLAPLTAPRPVVARPEVPFTVVPGSSVSVFVSTPVWVQVRVGDVALVELGAMPPKPTWFGTSTEGQECVAMRTHLRMSMQDVVLRPHRAVVQVTVRNQGADALQIERLWIPVMNLSLHLDQGRLWTQALELVRSEGQEHAERRILEQERGIQVAPPRELPEDNPVTRVFNSVFR